MGKKNAKAKVKGDSERAKGGQSEAQEGYLLYIPDPSLWEGCDYEPKTRELETLQDAANKVRDRVEKRDRIEKWHSDQKAGRFFAKALSYSFPGK